VLIGYLAGSIPFAYLAGKAHGIDLRQHGSGNLGATNAIRVLGKKTGLAVYLADTLKGFVPVAVLPGLLDTSTPHLWAIAIGVAAIIGHVKPIFLLGQGGGKGVATTGGVFFGLTPLPTLIAFLSFVVVVLMTKRVSIGSLTSAVVLPAGVIVEKGPTHPLSIICVIIALLDIWLHRGNIRRIINGTEPKFGEKREMTA
jgi:glycerol-3-phosphate acyltransferase PlsY